MKNVLKWIVIIFSVHGIFNVEPDKINYLHIFYYGLTIIFCSPLLPIIEKNINWQFPKWLKYVVVIFCFFSAMIQQGAALKKEQQAQQPQQPVATEWYKGGTLAGKTLSDWRNATYQNKLATCGDMFCTLQINAGRFKKTDKLNPDTQMKPGAIELLECIEVSAKDPNIDGSLKLSEMGVACYILIYGGTNK